MNTLAAVPAVLADDTARLLERFTEAAGAATLKALDADTVARLTAAFAKSLFIAEYAIRCPPAMLALVAAPDLGEARDRAAYDALLDTALAACTDTAAAKAALRTLRRAEMVRIAWRDLELGVDVDTIMAELSAFADAVVTRAVTPALAVIVIGCAAIISETGRLLDHGAAMARELGIPCIVSCRDAWSQLADGMIVSIDNDRVITR